MSLLTETIVLLLAAVIAVPICKRLGLGSVLGYLLAGILVGPPVLGLIVDVENMLQFSEIGIVLLLFLVGLELNPSRLWTLRKAVFGLGGAQVLVTALALFFAGRAVGLTINAAIVAGVGLALSSTAFVLPILAEKGQLQTRHGHAAFAILLFQDLAIMPLLAVLPFLSANGQSASGVHWLEIAKVLLAIALVVVAGRYLVRPIFRVVAAADSQEIFTATALLIVLSTAVLMHFVGLSMSLGAFLAGVMLAESEYRHEIEADIEPFKGIFLGLFFVAVGMSANLNLVREMPLQLLQLVLGFMLLKVFILYGIGRMARLSAAGSTILATALPQGGEFAFVLFGIAAREQILSQQSADALIVSVTASMILTPVFFYLNQRFVVPRVSRTETRPFDTIDAKETPVIIAGLGRFGQIVARVLRMRKISFTALEISQPQVDFLRKFNSKAYFGDASRLNLLRAAHADKAKALVLAIDDPVASMRTAETVKTHFPHLQIYARARNRQHAYQLMALGVKVVERETYLSSLDLARQLLVGMGLSESEASLSVEKFQEHDERLLAAQFLVRHDEKALIQTSTQAAAELETLFAADES